MRYIQLQVARWGIQRADTCSPQDISWDIVSSHPTLVVEIFTYSIVKVPRFQEFNSTHIFFYKLSAFVDISIAKLPKKVV